MPMEIPRTSFVVDANFIANITMLLTTIVGFFKLLHETRKVRNVAETAEAKAEQGSVAANTKLDDIHTLVNGRLDQALLRIENFEKLLGLSQGQPITRQEQDAGDAREKARDLLSPGDVLTGHDPGHMPVPGEMLAPPPATHPAFVDVGHLAPPPPAPPSNGGRDG